MDHVTSLKCLICGAEYRPGEIEYVCPLHGDDGIVDVQYDYELIGRRISPAALADNRDYTIWRYKPLLPVEPDSPVPPLTVGWTPLYRADRLGAGLGLKHVWVKDEGRQPSASFKDRASVVAVVKAQERGAEVITTASTGNAGAALSAMCASVAQKNVIFLPEIRAAGQSGPTAGLRQHRDHGARHLRRRVRAVCPGGQGVRLVQSQHGLQPLHERGQEDGLVREFCEQLGLGPLPGSRASSSPWATAASSAACTKGLRDLMALGWINKMPKIMGVQAAGSAALYDAWRTGISAMEMQPIDAHTIADSISAGLPADRIKGLAAVRETDGAYIKVTDEEILAAIPTLARGCGVFAEPAGAAAYAGLVKAVEQGLVHPDERIVVLSTGNGLKDIASARKSVGEPMVVDKNLDDVKACVNR